MLLVLLGDCWKLAVTEIFKKLLVSDFYAKSVIFGDELSLAKKNAVNNNSRKLQFTFDYLK